MKPQSKTMPGAALAQQLSPLSYDLDQLLSDLGGGVRSVEHFNELEERGAKIASGIRQAFRRKWDRT